MSKIWFCPTDGYEMRSRGRCHLCRQRLVASPLPELEVGDDDDEVGYRIDDWTDAGRGRLIGALIDAGILHRFEDDELVVEASNEDRVDDLVAEVAELAAAVEPDPYDDSDGSDSADSSAPSEVQLAAAGVAVALLADAVRRLQVDPTDMQADGDVAEASAGVFMVDRYPGADADTWAAIGRVTRRLLAALGAEEALEQEIQVQSSTLSKLLDTVERPGLTATGSLAGADHGTRSEDDEKTADADDETDPADQSEPTDDGENVDDHEDVHGEHPGETVYELPEWLPEQRARLSVLLDEAKVAHEWDQGDLVVPVDKESVVEGLFDRIEGIPNEEDDEERYRAIEELFAAVNRLAGDPSAEDRGKAVIETSVAVEGPTPLGLDDGQWWALRSRTRTLADAIEHGADPEVVSTQAATLRDLLRALV